MTEKAPDFEQTIDQDILRMGRDVGPLDLLQAGLDILEHIGHGLDKAGLKPFRDRTGAFARQIQKWLSEGGQKELDHSTFLRNLDIEGSAVPAFWAQYYAACQLLYMAEDYLAHCSQEQLLSRLLVMADEARDAISYHARSPIRARKKEGEWQIRCLSSYLPDRTEFGKRLRNSLLSG